MAQEVIIKTMDQLITSGTKNYKISQRVIGFAGIDDRSRMHIDDVGDLILITHKDYKFILYYNPAADFLHQPQDSLGIVFDESSIKFALADGVSIVQGILENDSGELAKRLVIHMCQAKVDNKLGAIEKVVTQFKSDGYFGASTLITGEINGDKLKTLFIGSEDDIGDVRLFHNKQSLILAGARIGKVDFFNYKAHGFAGEDFRHDQGEQLLPNHFALVVASDGAEISNTELKKILKVAKEEFSLETLREAIKRAIKENPDDQSLLIIMKNR